MTSGRFELFESALPGEGRWRWRLTTPDRDITLTSGAAFRDVDDARADALSVQAAAVSAPIVFVVEDDPHE